MTNSTLGKYIAGENLRLGNNTLIHDGVKIGDNVTIGDNCIIYPNSVIGDDTFIGPFSTIGEPLNSYYSSNNYVNPETVIGEGSLIRSYSIIYSDVKIGSHFQTGHRVTIREKAIIGNYVRIGTLSDIQGHCQIGNYVSMHSNVHICQKSSIADYVWIFPYVVLTNDPTPPSEEIEGPIIDSFAIIATGSIILPGVHVGEDSLIGALSLVRKDVPKETLVMGNPAKEMFSVRKIKNKHTGKPAYPWRHSFKRGMPWEETSYDEWYKSLEL